MAQTREVRITVITPERKVVEENAASIVFPAHDGELGVLLDRAPLLCELGVGQLRFTLADGVTRRMLIDGGFAQVNHNAVTVLTSNAMTKEDVTDRAIADFEAAAANITGSDDASVAARTHARQKLTAMRLLRSQH